VANRDNLEVVVDTVHRLLSTHSSIVLRDLSAGPHTVALEGVAENCAVQGSPSLSPTIRAGATVDVAFAITCATTGFQITTRTTGYDNPFAYAVTVNGQSALNDRPLGEIGPDTSLVVSRVEAGTYSVGLVMPGAHCTVPSGQPITVEVANRAVTPVQFEITCVAPMRPEKIAYVSVDGQGSPGIALMNPDGSGQVTLAFGYAPAWSPDGARLAFSTTQYDYYYDRTGGLKMMDTELQRFIPLSTGDGGTSPAWAPSGDMIAFIDGRTGLLTVMRPDGSQPAPVFVPGATVVNDLAWSPDGRRIAFQCLVDPGNYDVCTINSNGSGLVRLTRDPQVEGHPAWSHDGTRIAFATATGLTSLWQIALVAVDGGAATRLTDGFDPAWSRDGTKLVFARDSGLFTIDVDGSNLKRLTTGRGDHAPAWRP
jgi:Tol biopolymer transport system component